MPYGTPMNAGLVEAMQHLIANPQAWINQMQAKADNPASANRPDLKTAEAGSTMAIWLDSKLISTEWMAKVQAVLPQVPVGAVP